MEEIILGATQRRFWLCIENVRSAYNVGAMFRTADATGLWGIITCGITPPPSHIRVHKTSLGAEKSVPWYQFESTGRFIRFLKSEQLLPNLWSLELTDKAVDLFEVSQNEVPIPLYLAVGNEVEGVSSELLVNSSRHIKIPMNGIKVSLNVAEAASIAMYEFYRKFSY